MSKKREETTISTQNESLGSMEMTTSSLEVHGRHIRKFVKSEQNAYESHHSNLQLF